MVSHDDDFIRTLEIDEVFVIEDKNGRDGRVRRTLKRDETGALRRRVAPVESRTESLCDVLVTTL